MDLNLRDSVTVVTGGANGIGRAVSEVFATEGSRVVIWDAVADVSDVAIRMSEKPGCDVVGYRVDVTDRGALRNALAQSTESVGPVDHLVHCAAVSSGRYGFPFTNIDPDDWSRVLDVNVMGMVNVAHLIAPSMMERKRGTMIFLSSVAGQIGSPTDPPYSASKAANINFSQCLARDLAPHGVRVNTICPGMVMTPLNKSVWQAWYNQQDPDERMEYGPWADKKIAKAVPLQRWQQPEDVGRMAAFLTSDMAANVTGQTINVDGGQVMTW